jgi:hypothetical protein
VVVVENSDSVITDAHLKALYNFNIPDVRGDEVKIHIPGTDKILDMKEVQILVDF